MKGILLLLTVLFLSVYANAQNNDADTAKINIANHAKNTPKPENSLSELEGREDRSERRAAGLVPPMIIILNYSKVISMEAFLKIKKADILKRYIIENKPGIGEVEKVMIVETKKK
jgi:hypothetical protein